MPQSPLSDLVITNAGTIIRQVDTVQFTGDGVTITPGTPNPRVAVVNIPGGGGGSPTLAAGALLGNPGTISAPGTNVTVGSGLTMTNDGSLEATGGGGSYTAGLGLYLTSGTFGNTGTIVQPAGIGTHSGAGIVLTAGYGSGTYPSQGGSNYFSAGNNTASGTSGWVYAGNFSLKSGYATATDTIAGVAVSGALNAVQGAAVIGTMQVGGAGFSMGQNYVYAASGVILGGDVFFTGNDVVNGATGSHVGNLNFSAGSDHQNVNPGGNLVFTPGTGSANGVLLVNNIGTVDPHILNAKWQTSVAGVGYVGVYSKG